MDNVADILTVFFLVCKIYLRVGFIEALDSKGIINALKRYYVTTECADVVVVTKKIVFTLQLNLARSHQHDFICNFASISCGLRQIK